MTRRLMCISSKMLGWMKKLTHSGSRVHLFQELGMTKKKKILFADNVGFQKNQHDHMKSDQHDSLHAA